MFRVLILFILIKIFVYSENVVVSNGTMKLKYSLTKNLIEKIENISSNQNYIESLQEAIFMEEKLIYPKETDVSYVENTGIIRVINKYPEGIQTEKYIYITERRNLIYIESSAKNPKNKIFDILYTIKPAEKIEQLKNIGNNYIYDNFYFSVSNEKDLYFANEKELRELKLFPLGENRIKEYDKDIILFLNSNISGKMIISPFRIDNDYFDYSVIKELMTWQNWIKPSTSAIINRAMVTLKMLQSRDGSIKSFDRLVPKLNVDDMLYSAEALIEWEYFDEAKRLLTYFLTAEKENPNSPYLISNYTYYADKREKKKNDRYGEVISYYNSALFLHVFSRYIEESNDLDFFKLNKQEVDKSIYYYLLSKLKNGELEKDSGKREIGLLTENIETYSLVYKSISEYLRILESSEKNIDFINDKKKLEELKLNFENKFILNEEFTSTLSKYEIPELQFTYYLDKQLFNDEEAYKIYIRNLVRKYWNKEDLNLITRLEFNKKLLDIDYYNTYRRKIKELEDEVSKENNLFLNEYNEIDIEATARYLILKAIRRKDEDTE